MKRIRTILHPTDFSAGSEAAFQYASDLARDYGARLIVLHALEPAIAIAGEGALVPFDLDELGAEARRRLEDIPAGRGVRLDRVLREGPSALTVVEVAREVNADLIVMGTHGRTGIGRLFLGSVAEEVLRKAPCPVLTVKAGQAAKADKTAARAAAGV
jgi:nucleotide-binding universal stress UspA family protein